MKLKITVDFPELGKAIKKARKAKGLSQRDLGDFINLSPARISELETETEGKSVISAKQLILLETFLEIELVPFIEIVKAVTARYENSKKE
ncbi:MAG: helix-turn-helix transcriptional regulator [Cyanobacteria bacterium P01_A01_bin.83]